MTVVRRARRIERNRVGLRILVGVLVALQRVSFGVGENNQKRIGLSGKKARFYRSKRCGFRLMEKRRKYVGN
jgi:hypothetical protein